MSWLGGEDDEHDVGDAGDGQRDEGGVDDGDEEEAEESEAEEEVQERIGIDAAAARDSLARPAARSIWPRVIVAARSVILIIDAIEQAERSRRK